MLCLNALNAFVKCATFEKVCSVINVWFYNICVIMVFEILFYTKGIGKSVFKCYVILLK